MATRRGNVSGRSMNKRIRRVENEVLRKEAGKWFYLDAENDFTTSASAKGSNIALPLPDPTGDGHADEKVTIYGMDALVSIVLDDGSTNKNIRGGLFTLTERAGQDWTEFMGPQRAYPKSLEGNVKARVRSAHWFNIVPGTDWYKNVIIPFTFFRGNKITLLQSERFQFVCALGRDLATGVKISFSLTGRYRFINSPVAG